jgi:hypothetical protein
MLGYATESIDYNLPVDAITRKPVFAFSCNRRIRESYNGPLLRTVDGDVYPADLEASVGKKVVNLYDQKIRFNCPAFNVEAVGDVFLRKKVTPTTLYYLELSPGAYFEIPEGMATFFTEDAGVLTVCDPSNSDGRAPIFSASNSENELCFDVGSAYMRINHYKISERHQLFGGLDSPDQEYNAYLGNFSEKTVIRNSSGFSGVSLRKDAISSGLTDAYIGRDATGNTYSGEIYELIIGDFEIPNDSVNEAFRDMIDFYALT